MKYVAINRCNKSLCILSFMVVFLTGCATSDELATQSSGGVVACPNFPGMENNCDFDYSPAQDFHAEYSQQLLPINERDAIIRQESEDADDHR